MEKTIAVYDLDGTLFDTDDKIRVKFPDSKEWMRFSGADFNVIRNALPKGTLTNFDEFIGIPPNARPIIENLKLMDLHIEQQHDIGILTARMNVEAIWLGLSAFLKYKDAQGNFIPVPENLFKKNHIFSADTLELRRILDSNYSIPHAKAYVLTEILLKEYDKIYFYDDDKTNIDTVKNLNNHRIEAIRVVTEKKSGTE